MGRVKGNDGHPVVAMGRVKGNGGHPVVAMGRVKAGGGQALDAHGTCDGETCGECPAAQGFNLSFVPTEWSQKVRWFGRMAKEEVVSLVRAADVNVVTFRHEPLFYENSPNKFFDGIAAGLPAVFNRSTWLEPWLREYDCGIVCKGERPGEEMAEALRDLADDPERRWRMGAGARRLAEEVFSRERLAEVYLGVIATVGLRS
jgi:glycosyltransferase involved in cell wall biosynthesis